MASYARANGEAQTSDFVTLTSKEYSSNPAESYRLCVTAMKGIPKMILTKVGFTSVPERWLLTGKNFYFSKEA